MPTTPEQGWTDLFAEGRASLFALVCLGVWLNAADSLVTATIMPSVGAELGGYAYFAWAIAGFLGGGIMAGASAGRLSELFGLRLAIIIGALVLCVGCVMSAAAPNIAAFLAGRLLQGAGSGWISGFAMVAIALLFPPRHLAKVFAAVSGLWGIATVLGPLIGGLAAQAGEWRAVFWLFALQAALFAVAALWLLRNVARPARATGAPWLQLAVLGLGVGAVAAADAIRAPGAAIAAVAVGLALMALVLRLDARARVRLFPHRAGDLRTICGSGYASAFALTAASMGLSVYGPAILQELRGLSPLWAGYAVSAEAMAWTLAAFWVANLTGAAEGRSIRAGALCVLAGAAMLAVVMRAAPVGWVVTGAAVLGTGFGLSTSLTNRQVLGALADEDRAIGSSALIAVRQIGGAVGAAVAGVSANLAGFGRGLTVETAQAAAVWVFVAAVPLALAGTWAAFRMTGTASRA